jgi:hypothetical protein
MRRLLIVLVLLGAGHGTAVAAPRAELWERWQRHDPAATATVDHGAFDALLARHVRPGTDGVARFAYAAVTPDERSALAAYVARLEAMPVSALARPEQMAYWINLYNALTLKVVLDHYPVASIRDIGISPGLLARGPWGAKLVTVEGERLSLDDIEHRILRPIWRDPRIHYAVNCASIGCPDLRPAAWRAVSLDAELTAAAIAYVNHPRGVRLDGDRLQVSSIYDWFAEDFGGDERGVIRHLRAYAAPELAKRLDGRTRIDRHGYDWALNEAR